MYVTFSDLKLMSWEESQMLCALDRGHHLWAIESHEEWVATIQKLQVIYHS